MVGNKKGVGGLIVPKVIIIDRWFGWYFCFCINLQNNSLSLSFGRM